jgi:hypothetical protein
MYFLGYHGTSEAHALSILGNGVLAEKLSPNGQIGKGFYIAKLNGALPRWGAEIATTEGRAARRRAWYSNPFWKRVLLYLSGNQNLPFGDTAKMTILKVYSTRPLNHTRWSIMKLNTIEFIKATGGLSHEMQTLDLPDWLQMVIPVDEVPYLVCTRDDGVIEHSQSWHARESPF